MKLDFFRKQHEGFTPRTPFAALKAYEEGILPIEHFIYKSTSIRQLDEKPYDLEAIERVIAKKNLDLNINSFLIKIFEKMVKDKDTEIALFAAESINLIETRYNEKIEKIKKMLKSKKKTELYSKLARLYFELAVLNEGKITIRNFYYNEAYSNLKMLLLKRRITRRQIKMMVEILLSFKLYDQATSVLSRLKIKNEPYCLILQAEIEFKKKNFTGVFKIISKLALEKDKLKPEEKEILSYWIGQDAE